MISPASPEYYDERVEKNLDRPFAIAGRRSYLLGHMNGRFPDMGHHLMGEMGGLWSYPLKLADGFWFGISADQDKPVRWMYGRACRAFTMKMGSLEREFSLKLGRRTIEATQKLWVPENGHGVIASVTLQNPGKAPASMLLHWLVRFDIQGTWWSGLPDRYDEAEYDPEGGSITAHDSLTTEWAACMLGSRKPDGLLMGGELFGPQRTGSLDGMVEHRKLPGMLPNPEELQGGGVSGQLNYTIELAPGESLTLHFALAGGAEGSTAAYAAASDLLARREALWEEKEVVQAALAARFPSIVTPRDDLDRVFTTQNPCMELLTLTLPSVGTGLTAGLHGFGWFFGCDTYYSASGYAVAGQSDAALSTLRILADYARRQGGRTPHEITPSGILFNPGNTVETSMYCTTVERLFRWTGDRAFLEEVYPVMRQGIFDYMLGTCDPNGDLLPDGAGLLELSTAHHGKKLDVACSLYQGLLSLAYMAEVVGDDATAEQSRETAERVKAQIERHFWVPRLQDYVWRIEPNLTVRRGEPTQGYATLEMGVIDDMERAELLFSLMESPEHTGPRGLIHPGRTDFVMPIGNGSAALAEFAYGRPDRGLWYLERMADLSGYYMPWAIPEMVGRLACFIQAWSSAAYNWLMVQGFLRLVPDPVAGTVHIHPQLPTGWDRYEVRNLEIWGTQYDLMLTRAGDGYDFHAREAAGGREATHFIVVPTTETALPVRFA